MDNFTKELINKNIYEDRRYVIKCSKCKYVFEYGIEDMRIEISEDKYGRKTYRDKIVCCPKCGRDYDYGFERY